MAEKYRYRLNNFALYHFGITKGCKRLGVDLALEILGSSFIGQNNFFYHRSPDSHIYNIILLSSCLVGKEL